jgi:cytochrome c oxidase subunit 2
MAGELDALYTFLLLVSATMTVLIFFLVFFFAVKYRRRSPHDPMPKPIHSSIPLEIIWTVIPFGFMLIMFAWGTKMYYNEYTPPTSNTLDIYVIGKQWMWKVQYPGGQREIDELHVPTGRSVKLTLASEDVIHSFFIPAFRLTGPLSLVLRRILRNRTFEDGRLGDRDGTSRLRDMARGRRHGRQHGPAR